MTGTRLAGSRSVWTHAPGAAGLDQTCTNCSDWELQALELVKQRILDHLGLKEPPRKPFKAPSGLMAPVLREWRQMNKHKQLPFMDDAQESARRQAVIIVATRTPMAEGVGLLADTSLADEILYFELPPDLSPRSLSSARILLQAGGTDDSRPAVQDALYAKLYQPVPVGSTYILEDFATRTIQQHDIEYDFVSIDVTDLVSGWLKSPRDNNGVVVRSINHNGTQNHALFSALEGEGLPTSQEQSTILEVQLEPTPAAGRDRRAVDGSEMCADGGSTKSCCLYPLEVDFLRFSWDWVIAPTVYQANYCRGECPPVYLQQYPHAHIAEQIGGNAGPCCGPRRLDGLLMLYWDPEGRIRLDNLPDMIVRNCACL
ncbi:growth/differentiation factor 8-like [Pollicipes pollicipes]|uniref:growth/differentiation factor 8-like n=1 Tax=Pollicipes pollicipes TaxID=41117 RepID=UPI001884CA31|nr:growth/differentiation factor 8-like [Pollicipes pollicipes]